MTNENSFEPSLQPYLEDPRRTLLELDRIDAEESLAAFVRLAWPVLEPNQPYVHGWHIDAMAEHLEAVTHGDIRRLLINVPPGMMKSLMVNVFWPAWEWGPKHNPSFRYVAAAHSIELSGRDNLKMRRLVTSPWFQMLWPHVQISKDQNQKINFENTATGFRIAATSNSITGRRGDRVLIDDPLSATEANSDIERNNVNRWFQEAVPTRLNNPDSSAIVVVMQRLHEDDVSGHILSNELEYEHLCLPMRFEEERRCITSIGFRDPRLFDGELLFPERFSDPVVTELERTLGTYSAAGQLQQRPEPRGGGILKRGDWNIWDYNTARFHGVSNENSFPDFEYKVASLDTAYTEKTENDPSALTIWGVWRDRNRLPRLMLMYAWARHLELHELVTSSVFDARRFRVDKLLIESKASGLSVAQEIRRQYASENWSTQIIDPKNMDKVSRAYKCQAILEAGLVYAPDRRWAANVIDQCAKFPRGKHDDLVDSTTMAWNFLRDNNLLFLKQEREPDYPDGFNVKGNHHLKPLYPT